MQKRLAIVFITIYLGQFFFCTFWRIESWPFSDYRIFQKDSHPKLVNTYSPYLKLSNGSYVSIIKEKLFYINNNHFVTATDKYKPLDYEKYINNLIHSKGMKQAVDKMRKQNLFPIKFIVMQVKFVEIKKHKWQPVYTPFKKYDLL